MLDKQTFILIMEQTPLIERKRVFVRHSKKGQFGLRNHPADGVLGLPQADKSCFGIAVGKRPVVIFQAHKYAGTRLRWAVELE
jgi:hypothetical protein